MQGIRNTFPFLLFCHLRLQSGGDQSYLGRVNFIRGGTRVRCVVPLAKVKGCEQCGGLMGHAEPSSSASGDEVPPSPSAVN